MVVYKGGKATRGDGTRASNRISPDSHAAPSDGRRAVVTTAGATNRYYRRSRLSERKFRDIVRCFAVDITATDTANLTGISVRSVNSIFIKLRQRVAEHLDTSCLDDHFSDSAEESRQAMCLSNASTPTMIGLRAQQGRIITEILPASLTAELREIVCGCRDPLSVVRKYKWLARFHGLVDMDSQRYIRIQLHETSCPTNQHEHKCCDIFWVFAKYRMHKFKGVHKRTLCLHIKETEYRFNYRRDDLYQNLLCLLRKHPI